MTAISRVKQVRLGFIGCGFMGQLAHLANHARLPGVELAALSDLRPRTPHAVAEKYGIPRVYQRHTDMLKAGDLDAVVAIMNFACHADVVPDVLNAGLHLFTEKPAAVRPETASRHAEMARKRNLVYHVGYMKRCDPASIRMREIIRKWQETGAQGKLKYLRV
ncbi:MAG: Gfo/Idh/MocA family oxidoreductase, partial [Candidatus Sumerlaeia bacterium]|nr:Gfo/Idh/MocA family oxidoreductase [Candidatus Sumerlaeia bacterium]